MTKCEIKLYATGIRNVKDEDLLMFLKNANDAYRNGDPFISDALYDRLWTRGKKLFKEDPFFRSIETEMYGDTLLPIPMLSVKKVYTKNDLTAWYNTLCKRLNVENINLKVTPKLDGYGVYYDKENDQLITRGDGVTGTDVSHAIKRGLFCDGSGKGEIVVKSYEFKQMLGDKYSNPRNVISSIIKKGELSSEIQNFIIYKHVQFIAFSQLPVVEIDDFQHLVDNIESIFDKVCDIACPTDGIIIEILDDKDKEILGNTKKYPKWQIAFKKKGEEVETTVTDVTYQVGMTGRVTPVIHITPTLLKGTVIAKVNGHNYNLLKAKGLGIGSTITITKAGEVIPKMVDVLTHGKELDPLAYCPCCNRFLTISGQYFICENTKCHDKVVAILDNWCKENHIKGIGTKMFDRIVERGVSSISDLLKMSEVDLQLAGVTVNTSEKLVQLLKTKSA